MESLNNSRILLSKARGGDYTHAGEAEAIELVMEKVAALSPGIREGNCLDVGSGLGGTAAYLYERGFKHIWGIDVDEAAVGYAQKRYPQVEFVVGDAKRAAQFFKPRFFSFIYLMNVLYAIEDKGAVLKELARVAAPGAILAIFDYTGETNLQDLSGQKMYPLILSDLKLEASGWELIEVEELSQQYIEWYDRLLKKLKEESLRKTFLALLEQLKEGSLGGGVVYARYRS